MPRVFGLLDSQINALHYVQMLAFSQGSLVVEYHIFCEINVVHKELRDSLNTLPMKEFCISHFLHRLIKPKIAQAIVGNGDMCLVMISPCQCAFCIIIISIWNVPDTFIVQL